MTRGRLILWCALVALLIGLCALVALVPRLEAASARVLVLEPEPIRALAMRPGDVLRVDGALLILEMATVRDGLLRAEFLLVNDGLYPASIDLDRLVAVDGRAPLTRQRSGCGRSLWGRVKGGRVESGAVCWTGSTSDAAIYYEPAAVGVGRLVWESD